MDLVHPGPSGWPLGVERHANHPMIDQKSLAPRHFVGIFGLKKLILFEKIFKVLFFVGDF